MNQFRVPRFTRGFQQSRAVIVNGTVRTLTLLAVSFCLAGTSIAEQPSIISLGSVSGLPDSEVMVPVMWTPSPPELKLGRFFATVRFEDQSVSFLRGEAGFLLAGVNAKFKIETKKEPTDPKQSELQLEVFTEGEPRQGLREGLIMTLIFRIAEKATAGTKVPLALLDIRTGDLSTPPKAIQPVEAQAGEIQIISPEEAPYVSCFFFTH